MDNQDKKAFLEMFNGLTDYYRITQLSKPILNIYFGGLSDYSFDQVEFAIGKHMADPKSGQFMPKIADIVRHIQGGEITTDQVLAAARLANTPFGILCRIQIGTYDLEHQTDMFYLKQRAEECLAMVPEWKAKAVQGDYSDHALSIMLKHRVSPYAPFSAGLPKPNNLQALKDRIDELTKTPQHQLLIAGPTEYSEDGEEFKAQGKMSEILTKIINE